MDAVFSFTILHIVMWNAAFAINDCPQPCQCWGQAVHCASKEVTRFPSMLPNDTLQLMLQNNSITTLTNLKSMKKLKLHTLTLQDNSIVHLMPRIFNSVTTLSYLDLSSNDLRTISRSSFANLKHLKLLNLARNKITRLAPKAFSDLTSLQELFLSENQIFVLPRGIFSSAVSLTTLRLNHNRIPSIPDGLFSHLRSLTHLDFSNNQQRALTSRTLQGLSQLQDINLSNNKISILDPQFVLTQRQCPEELNDGSIEQNLDSSNPGVFSSLLKLQSINLNNNSLMAIRYSSFSRLSRLNNLWLNGNYWRCDCFLKWSLMRLNSENAGNRVNFGPMYCAEPEQLSGVPIVDLTLQDLRQYDSSNEHLAISTPRKTSGTKLTAVSTRNNANHVVNAREVSRNTQIEPNLESDQISPTTTNINSTNQQPTLAQNCTSEMKSEDNLQSNSKNLSLVRNSIEYTAPPKSHEPDQFPGLASNTSADKSDVVNQDAERQKDQQRQTNQKHYTSNKHLSDSKFVTMDPESFHKIHNHQSYTKQQETTYQLSKQPDFLVIALLIAAISTSVLAAILGCIFLITKYANNCRYGCCYDKKPTSGAIHQDSMRSYTTYPLVYDNPLARRPLPNQPVREAKPPFDYKRNRKGEEHIGVRWTCGGTFRLGENTEAGKRFSIAKVNQNCEGHAKKPPAVPPRLHKTTKISKTQSIEVPSTYSQPIDQRKNVSIRPLNLAGKRKTGFLSPNGNISTHRNSISNSQHESEYLVPIKSKRSGLYSKYPGANHSTNNKHFEENFDLIPINFAKQSLPASVYEFSTTNNAQQSKRELLMEKMIQVLDEFESLDQTSDNHERYSKEKNVVSWKNIHKVHGHKKKLNHSFLTQDSHYMQNSSLQARQSQTKHAEGQRSRNVIDSRKSFYSASQQVNQNGRFAEKQDVNFPMMDNTITYLSPQQLQHDMSVQSSPKHFISSDSIATTAKPMTRLNKKTFDDYSLLSLCSSGSGMMPGSDCSKKRDYKKQYVAAKGMIMGRKKSSDSMFVSVDSSDVANKITDNHVKKVPKHTRPKTKTINHTTVKYRRSSQRDEGNRLKKLKSEHRKSMPSYNELLKSSSRRASNHRLQLAAKKDVQEKVTDRILCEILNKHDLSHLELSLSDSEQENYASSAESRFPKFEFCKIKPTRNTDTNETINIQSNSYSLRKASEASLGSISVSSIEFENMRVDPKHRNEERRNKTLQCEETFQEYDNVQVMGGAADGNPRRADFENQKQLPLHSTDKKVKAKRCYFDVLESSTDELSTDIEMIGLGTMHAYKLS